MKMNVYEFYKEMYKLETLSLDISKEKVFFLIYDDKYHYYFLDHYIIFDDENVDILKKIDILKSNYKIEITNFYPVCYCSKTLVIALKTNIAIKYSPWEIPIKYQPLIRYHKENYATAFVSLNIKKEISMSQKYINRYRIHEKVFKKYFLTKERRRKKEFGQLLHKLLPQKSSIIDVSCGDNSDIFLIAEKKKYKTIVGNDICLNYLNLDKKNNVIYTNDDIEANRIKENAYDVSFCKNTLHHMNNLTNINNALDFLNTISKTIIIVEIMNPKEYRGLPKFLNKYLYTIFLKDVGSCYLDEEQFKSIIDRKFGKYKIEYKTFVNILGTYKIAKIIKKED